MSDDRSQQSDEPDDLDLRTDGPARRTWLLTEAVAAVDGFGEAARLAVALEAWIENGGAFDIDGLDIDAPAPRLEPPKAETPAPRALPKPVSKSKPESRVQEAAGLAKEGLKPAAIAARMGLKASTVRVYLTEARKAGLMPPVNRGGATDVTADLMGDPAPDRAGGVGP